jgi:hypothetical protein
MIFTKIRTYSELIKLHTFEERFRYLKLDGRVAEETFGFDRWLNQKFYTSDPWKSFRNDIILRDNACDMAFPGYDIVYRLVVHHLNPITKEDILTRSSKLFDPENVVCVSDLTHKAIHYGDKSLLPQPIIVRTKNDTRPWRK